MAIRKSKPTRKSALQFFLSQLTDLEEELRPVWQNHERARRALREKSPTRARSSLAGKVSQPRLITSQSTLWRLPYPLVVRHVVPSGLCVVPGETSLLAEQFLQSVQVASCLQVACRKVLAQERGRHLFPRDACSALKSLENMHDPILRQRSSPLRKEEMI
jgi:hypothetical protein